MFDVGFWELSVIGIVALVIVGPERLPSLVSEAGKWAGRARGTIRDLKYDLQRQAEIEQLSDLGKDLKNAQDSINPRGLKKNFNDLVDDAESKAKAEITDAVPDGQLDDVSLDLPQDSPGDRLVGAGVDLGASAPDKIDPEKMDLEKVALGDTDETAEIGTAPDTSTSHSEKTNRTS